MRQSAFIANAVQVVLTGMLWMLSAQAFGQSPSDAPLPLSQLQIHDEFLQPYFPDGLFIAFNPTLATVLQHPIEDASFREPGDPLTTRLLETRLAPHDDDRYVIDFSPGGSLDPTFLISRDDGHALQEIGQVFGLNLTVPGDGYLYVSGHTNTTFNQRRKFAIHEDTLIEIPQPLYYVGLETHVKDILVIYTDLTCVTPLAELPQGTTITVIANTDNFYLIKTPNDLLGWVQLDVGQDDTLIEGLFYFGD